MAANGADGKAASPSSSKGKVSRVALSSRSPNRPPSPLKKESTPSPRLHVRPKKVPLTARDVVLSVKRIIGSSAKSHRELNGSITSNGCAIVYSAGATVVYCNFTQNQEPTYRYYCAPPDQDASADLIHSVSSLAISSVANATSTPPSRSRYQNHSPRTRASMVFDGHRSSPSPSPGPSNGLTRIRSKGAKDRIRVLGCVAISSDQSWIVAGEVIFVMFY
jgi:hypothetical protein